MNATMPVVATHTTVIDERRHAENPYRIITADEEIIPMTGEQLVRACKLEISATVWSDNFWKMVEHIREWAQNQAARLQLVLVEFCNDKVVFYVVPSSDTYDFELGFQQAELETYLNTRGNIGYAETRQVPKWDLPTFVSRSAQIVWEKRGMEVQSPA